MPQNKHNEYKKLLSSLGLCARAGALIFGTSMVCEAMREKAPPLLVLEAANTSGGTHKRLTDKCTFYQVRHVRLACTGSELASALGKSASLAAVALRDEQLCRLIDKQLNALLKDNDPQENIN